MAAPKVFGWVEEALAELERRDLRRRLGTREGKPFAGEIRFDGKPCVNFGSNDYLGLAGHEALTQAAVAAGQTAGVGSGASPLITGRGTLHTRLESTIAEFERAEAALLFPTGYAANAGTIPALAGRGDVIFSDAKNHASIIDGCRLSGAEVRIYAHRDTDELKQLLVDSQAKSSARRLIVTDSLFSMDGDLAPLVELEQLAQEHAAMLLVDEAHATGVFGESGSGVCEAMGVESSPVLLRVGTLSKALGCMGGFVVGPQTVIEWLSNKARPYFFSTAPPEMLSAAALEAFALVRREPHRRTELLQLARHLRERLVDAGFSVGDSESQIVPVILGDPAKTMRVSASLRQAGMLVPGIRPPSVPAGQSLLRISLCYGHTAEHLEQLVSTISSG